jgi:signal transduction histidine kinase
VELTQRPHFDATPLKKYLLASRQAEDEQLMVSFSDIGVGLPARQIDQIFNAFFTTKTDRTGMGLRISRSIVEAYGGCL